MKAFRFTVLFLFVKIAAAQTPPSASLEGIATKWRSGEPMQNVAVELRSLTGERLPIPAALSAEDGRFFFPSVPPGKYRVVGMREGYLKSEFGQRSYGGPTQELTLLSGQKLSGVQLVLTPGAVISGKVTSNGRPAGAADVYAIKARNIDGRITASLVLSAKTNDLGEFSLFWLPPASYHIVAVASNTGFGARNILLSTDGDDRNSVHVLGGANRITATPPELGSGSSEAYVPMYFPGTPDIRAAQPIEVTPGTEIRNIVIDSRPLPAYRVRGRIDGRIPRARVTVRLDPLGVYFGEDGGSDMNSGGVRFTEVEPNGSFELTRVSPGAYALTIGDAMQGSMPLEVRGEITNLVVPPVQTVRPSANVIVEGVTPADSTSISVRIFVTLKSILTSDWDRNPVLHRLVRSPDGFHRLQEAASGIPVGDYRVFVEPVLTPNAVATASTPAMPSRFERMYVKSIRLRDTDVLRDGLRLQSQPADPLVIVLGTNPGALEGRVLNDRKEPVAAVWVALVPDGNMRFRNNYEFTVTDASGRFRLDNVPPGDYRLFAWEEAQRGEWEDPAFIRKYENLATPVHVGEASKVIVDTIAIPPPR